MLNFIIGLAIGFFAGVVMMCILFVAREKKRVNKEREM
jgi:tetrahydromethanopterin S-methyltransferase subunit F